MRRRPVASLLLALFLGAGTTLPGPDALLHHGSGRFEQGRTHVEPAGGCTAHAEQCTLGRTATGAQAALAHPVALRVQVTAEVAAQPAPRTPLIAADRGAIAQPRAPPAPAA